MASSTERAREILKDYEEEKKEEEEERAKKVKAILAERSKKFLETYNDKLEGLNKELTEINQKIDVRKKAENDAIEKGIEEGGYIDKRVLIDLYKDLSKKESEITTLKNIREFIGGNKKTKESDKYTVKQLKTMAFVYNVNTTKKSNGKIVNLKSDELLTKLKKSKILL